MKNSILLLVFALCHLVNAQNKDFTLGVVLPAPSAKLTESALHKLETKFITVLNKNTELQYGFSNDIVITPRINVEESSMVQGGLENIAVVKLEITYLIKQLSSTENFGSLTKRYTGSGKNESLAIANAFSQIKSNDKALQDFLSEAKQNIYSYYNQNCQKVLTKAANMAQQNDHEQAISLAQSIPDTGNSCYATAQQKSIEYYAAYQKKLCTKNMANAKAEIAANNFEQALYYLDMIDPSSTCFAEVDKLIAQLSTKVDRKEKQALDAENIRLKAMQEISKAYYQNAIQTTTYSIILK